jgi:hypothetical protein
VLAADTTMHTLPWYFGAAVVGAWAVVAGGILLLFRRRLRARAERRLDHQRPGGTTDRILRDDRSLESGKDLEPW